MDVESISKRLLSVGGKQEGLNEFGEVLASGCSTASFLGQLEKLFAGLRSCLQLDDSQSEIVIKANGILIDMLPDIQHSDDLEI